MKDMRKFYLTLASLIGYVTIALWNANVDPMALGLGIGFLLTPTAAANAFEHRYKNGKAESSKQ